MFSKVFSVISGIGVALLSLLILPLVGGFGGPEWIKAILFMGLIPSIILIISGFKMSNGKKWPFILAIVSLVPIIIGLALTTRGAIGGLSVPLAIVSVIAMIGCIKDLIHRAAAGNKE